MMLVPSRPRWSMRRSISSTGTGSETLSYSLQYAQERLQKRMGTICAMTGCRVEASAWPTMASSRALSAAALSLRAGVCFLKPGCATGDDIPY